MADKKQKQCIVIASCEVAHEHADGFLDSWEKANDFLPKQSGFVSTALHRAVSAKPDLRLVTWAAR